MPRTNRRQKAEWTEDRQRLFRDRTAPLTERVLEGRISVLEWNSTVRDELKGLYVTSYAAGRSAEWSQMSQADWSRVGTLLRQQYAFLRALASELRKDPGAFTPASLNARIQKFAASARQAMEEGKASEIGLDPAVLPAHPGDGTTSCYTNCKCRWAIRTRSKKRGNYDASWMLGAAEHCRECRRRAKVWRALRIRAGRLITPIEDVRRPGS